MALPSLIRDGSLDDVTSIILEIVDRFPLIYIVALYRFPSPAHVPSRSIHDSIRVISVRLSCWLLCNSAVNEPIDDRLQSTSVKTDNYAT